MPIELDLKSTLSKYRIVGIWRMLKGYQAIYLGAFICIGLAALAQTFFYFLLRYYTDNVLGRPEARDQLVYVAAGFVLLALWQVTEAVAWGEASDRAKAAAKAVVYAVLAGTTVTVLAGSGSGSGGSGSATAGLMGSGFGRRGRGGV